MSSVHTILQRISAFFAVLNNLILIVLIIFKSHKKIGKYKYLMIYISIFEIIYAILDTCAVPVRFHFQIKWANNSISGDLYNGKRIFGYCFRWTIVFTNVSLPSSFRTFLCLVRNFYGYFCYSFYLPIHGCKRVRVLF